MIDVQHPQTNVDSGIRNLALEQELAKNLGIFPETLQQLRSLEAEKDSPDYLQKIVATFKVDQQLHLEEKAENDPILALSLKIDSLVGNQSAEVTTWINDFKESCTEMLSWFKNHT